MCERQKEMEEVCPCNPIVGNFYNTGKDGRVEEEEAYIVSQNDPTKHYSRLSLITNAKFLSDKSLVMI